MAVSHTSRDDTGNVDGGVLLLAPHDVEAQALICFGQLHYSGMCVALAGCEGSHCGLGERKHWEVRAIAWLGAGAGGGGGRRVRGEDLGQGEQFGSDCFPHTGDTCHSSNKLATVMSLS